MKVATLSLTRVSELLNYATNEGEIDENTPGIEDMQRDVIVAYKLLMVLMEYVATLNEETRH